MSGCLIHCLPTYSVVWFQKLCLFSCIRGRLLEVNEAILETPSLLLQKVKTSTQLLRVIVPVFTNKRARGLANIDGLNCHLAALRYLTWLRLSNMHSRPLTDTSLSSFQSLRRARASQRTFWAGKSLKRFSPNAPLHRSFHDGEPQALVLDTLTWLEEDWRLSKYVFFFFNNNYEDSRLLQKNSTVPLTRTQH